MMNLNKGNRKDMQAGKTKALVDENNMKIKKTVAFLSNIGYTVRAYIL